MRKLLVMLTATLAMLSFGAGVPAYAHYQHGTFQFIVPWPPGDLEDTLTQMIAAELGRQTQLPVTVVYRPGGEDGPFPGAREVLEAPADGSVVGSFTANIVVDGPRLDVGFDVESFTPVGIFLTYPFVVASARDSGFSDMAELSEFAQDNDVRLGHF